MKQTFTFEGLKNACKGSVSKSTLEHYKKQGWLHADHATAGGTLRYTLDAVEQAKERSIQAVALNVDYAQPAKNAEDRWKNIQQKIKGTITQTTIQKRRGNATIR